MRGRALQRARSELIALDPYCAECKRNGLVRFGRIRDHIIPLAEGGHDAPENTQLLCDTCNEVKSKREAARGRGRS